MSGWFRASVGAPSRASLALRALLLLGTIVLLSWAGSFVAGLPALGAPDHGDYYRVAWPAGIHVRAVPREPAGGFPRFQRTFAISSSHLSEGGTSASAFARVARHLPAFDAEGRFDIRRLGLLYTTVAAGMIAAALLAGVAASTCFVLAWVFVDPNYLAFENSLYSEPPALLATLGLALWFSARSAGEGSSVFASRARASALLLCLVVGGMSRAPMAVLPCLVVAMLWAEWALRGAPRLARGELVAAAALALASVLPAAYFTVGPAPRFTRDNTFNAVFLGPLSASAHPEQTLGHLGLPPRFARYAGRGYYETNVPMGLKKRLDHVSYADRVVAYLGDAASARNVAGHVTAHLAVGVRATGSETGELPARASPPWRFGRFRSAVLGPHPVLVWVVFAGVSLLAAAALAGRVTLRSARALAFLCALAATQIVIAVLGAGIYGLARHLLVARFSFDSALGLAFVDGASLLAARARSRTS